LLPSNVFYLFLNYTTLYNFTRYFWGARAPGARTVPQIFIDGAAVGGSDDLAALEREGKLDALLGL
jgi:glutaredoxin